MQTSIQGFGQHWKRSHPRNAAMTAYRVSEKTWMALFYVYTLSFHVVNWTWFGNEGLFMFSYIFWVRLKIWAPHLWSTVTTFERHCSSTVGCMMQHREPMVVRHCRGNKSLLFQIQIGSEEPWYCDSYDNSSSSTVWMKSSPNPWNFLSVNKDKSVFCYVNKGNFGHHPRIGAGCQKNTP